MTVKELINKLLDCKMDANVVVLVEIDKDTLKYALEDYGSYKYPIGDDLAITDIDNFDTDVRIYLEEFNR